MTSTKSTQPSLAHPAAIEAFSRVPLIDGHNDLPWASRETANYSVEGLEVDSHFNTDIDKLRRGGVGGQFWSVFAPAAPTESESVQFTLEQIDFVYRMLKRYPETFELARTGDDVRRIWRSGRIASLLGAEGGHSIGSSHATLRMLARLGLRYMTLTHNSNNPWADSATDTPTNGGLSSFGRETVKVMNELGVLVDLSHVSPATMKDAIEASTSPVIFSHSACQALCQHPRNVPDSILKTLPANGGVIMIAFVPAFLDEAYHDWDANGRVGLRPSTTIDHLIEHIEHARDVAGVDHIGLGSDYDGCDDFPDELTDVSGFSVIIDRLAERGWSSDDLAKLMGENLLRVLDQTSAQALSALE